LATFKALLFAYGRKSEYGRLADIIQNMKEERITMDSKFYQSILHLFVLQGNTQESRSLFNMMKDSSVKIPLVGVIELFRSCLKRGDLHLAKSIIEEANQYSDTQFLVQEMKTALNEQSRLLTRMIV